jgi:hypothetical protein
MNTWEIMLRKMTQLAMDLKNAELWAIVDEFEDAERNIKTFPSKAARCRMRDAATALKSAYLAR